MNDKQIYMDLVEQIKEIDTKDISDNVDRDTQMKVVEKQKVYYWIRLFLKEELSDLEAGDDFEICYKVSGEKLLTKFTTFAKKNLNKDIDDEIVNYDPEDDKRILILMVDSDEFERDDLPFIRSLFKSSPYYQFQVYKRSDITFTNKRTGQNIDYIDCNF